LFVALLIGTSQALAADCPAEFQKVSRAFLGANHCEKNEDCLRMDYICGCWTLVNRSEQPKLLEAWQKLVKECPGEVYLCDYECPGYPGDDKLTCKDKQCTTR